MKTLLLILLAGCKLHHQESYTLGQAASSQPVVELNLVSQMFAHVAANNYFDLENTLKNGQVDLNNLNGEGQLLLVEAVRLGRILIADLLLQHEADPTLKDSQNQNAFDLVSDHPDRDLWTALLEGRGIDPEFLKAGVLTLVEEAAQDTQGDVIKMLDLFFDKGADVNTRNTRQYTLLMLAASRNLPEIVHFLCQTPGVDLNLKAGRYTALSLTKRLSRRNPDLNAIADILTSYGAQ